MNSSYPPAPHLRFCSAHWPKPLTAPGAAQACPTCLPSPANQLTGHGDMRLARPIERAVRFAPVPSQLGDGTRDDRLSSTGCRSPHLSIYALAKVFRPFATALPASAGSPQHAVRSGQIGSPAGTIHARAAHFQKAPASPPASLQISGLISGHSALSSIPLPTAACDALIGGHCSGGHGLRPLAPPSTADATNQRNFPDPAGTCRPFFGSSLSPKPRLRAQRIGGINLADQATSKWHDSAGLPPLPPGCDLRHSGFWLVCKFPMPGKRTRTARTSDYRRALARRDADQPVRLCLWHSPASLSNRRPHPPRLPMRRTGHNRHILPTRNSPPSAFSKSTAYLLETPDSCGVLNQPRIFLGPVRNIAPDALNCGHCSGQRALRFLGPSAIADAASHRSFPELTGFIRPFSPSSPAPNSRLRTQRTGDLTSFDLSTGVLGNGFRDSSNNPAQQIGLSYLRGRFPGPNDRRDSTFSRKKCTAIRCRSIFRRSCAGQARFGENHLFSKTTQP